MSFIISPLLDEIRQTSLYLEAEPSRFWSSDLVHQQNHRHIFPSSLFFLVAQLDHCLLQFRTSQHSVLSYLQKFPQQISWLCHPRRMRGSGMPELSVQVPIQSKSCDPHPNHGIGSKTIWRRAHGFRRLWMFPLPCSSVNPASWSCMIATCNQNERC